MVLFIFSFLAMMLLFGVKKLRKPLLIVFIPIVFAITGAIAYSEGVWAVWIGMAFVVVLGFVETIRGYQGQRERVRGMSAKSLLWAKIICGIVCALVVVFGLALYILLRYVLSFLRVLGNKEIRRAER